MYILHIFSNKNEQLAQIFDINNIKLKEKINDISKLNLDIDFKSNYANASYLIPWRKVKLFKISWKEEKELISGYLSEITASNNKLSVEILSEEILLERRVLKYSGELNWSIAWILEKMFANSWDNFKIISTEDYTYKDYSIWITYLDILQDIAGNKYEFKLKDNTLTFLESIGKDRNQKEYYKDFRYNLLEYWDSNIKSFKTSRKLKNFANVVLEIWRRKYSNENKNTESIEQFGKFEEAIKMKSFDSNSEIKNYIKSRFNPEIEYEISPISNNYFEVWIWDIIPVKIETWNDLTRTDEKLKVIEKSLEVKDLNIIKIKLAKRAQKNNSTKNRIKSLEESVNGLELS